MSLFGKELDRKVTQRRIFLWNAIGSLCNAGSSLVLLVALTRILGTVEGGIFSISFALAQQMTTVACFETSTYQVTDSKNKFGFSTYFTASVLLYFASVVFGLLICIQRCYPLYKCAIVILLCLYKGLDAFNSTCGAAMHRKGRLDIGGKSFALRIFGSTVLFISAAIITKDLLISAVLMLCFSILWVIFYEIRYTAFFEKIAFDFSLKRIFNLLVECTPLFLGVFLMTYISNQPKYAIDSIMRNETVNNIFSIIFMPSALVNLLSLLMYRPLLTGLTAQWANGNHKNFAMRIYKISLIIFTVIILCVLGAYIFGIELLSMLYGVNLKGFKAALCIAIAGGGFYAYSSLIYNAIVILRKQKLMIFAYLAASGCAIFLAPWLVKQKGIVGGSLVYLISCCVLAACLTTLLVILFKKEKINKRKRDS